jgi:hypothetical protein
VPDRQGEVVPEAKITRLNEQIAAIRPPNILQAKIKKYARRALGVQKSNR